MFQANEVFFLLPIHPREVWFQALSLCVFRCSWQCCSLALIIVPLEPRSDLPPLSAEDGHHKYYECLTQLFQLQPIWDKRYLVHEVMRHFPNESLSTVQTAITTVISYVGYTVMDGPFRSSWLRFGYDPAKDPQSWTYQYIEFRFSKRPQLKEETTRNPSLPVLYELELNLHNRYPLCVLRVVKDERDEGQKDKEMEQLINRIHPQTTFDKRRGWIAPEDMLQIRNLLKKQAVLLLEKCGYNTDVVGIV